MYPLSLSDVNETLIVSTDFSKNNEISKFIKKTCPVEVELFHADRRTDGRTDTTKLIIAFRNFGTASKIQKEQNTSQNNSFQ